MSYIDAHLHPQALVSLGDDFVVPSEIRLLYCNAAQEQEWNGLLAMARHCQEIIPFLGVHPWYCTSWTAASQQHLVALIDTGQVRGLGEIGLDRPCGLPLVRQEEVFGQQLALAQRYGLPVAIHCVRYWGRLCEIMEDLRPCPLFMIHGYSGSLEIMIRLQRLGGYFSFGGGMAEPGQDRLRQVFVQVPLERLFLETDAPWQRGSIISLPPGQSYQPTMLRSLYQYAADLRQFSLTEFTNIIFNNGQIFTHS